MRLRRLPRSDVVQFRAPVFRVAASALHCWMAVSRLAPQPVAFYAAVFFLVNATYVCLIRELIDRSPVSEVSPTARRSMHVRSITTLCLFGLAALVALKYPLAGLGICICCLIVYLRPDPPGVRNWRSRGKADAGKIGTTPRRRVIQGFSFDNGKPGNGIGIMCRSESLDFQIAASWVRFKTKLT